MKNQTMMQFFEWHVEADGNHWNRLKEAAAELKMRGIDSIWIPPATKGQSAEDTGYGVYDLYDLGEFDQKGTVRTKYGTKEELLAAIDECHMNNIKVCMDIVMNHKAAADDTELFKVIEVDPHDRTKEISAPFDIEGWTKFDFPGRGDKYSTFKWNFEHFNGTDYDNKTDRVGVFRICGDDKNWNENVDSEFGNYDYLMFANIDYNREDVREEMTRWGKWLYDSTHCDGYRLDAIKHINHDFIRQFVIEMMLHSGKDFYVVGEFWNPELEACRNFLDNIEYKIDLFDVSLHYKLHEASIKGREFDLSTIFDDTLVKSHPLNAVTFVDNHDSQPHEALQSWVEPWFKPSAYALILLRQEGLPCVFYGDYYGIKGPEPRDGMKDIIDRLLYVRQFKAYGEQVDYFDHPNTIGWVRKGIPAVQNSGCAVVVSNGHDGEKTMNVGEERAGEVWVDITHSREEKITIGEDGSATFPVNGGCLSVWSVCEEE